MKQKRLLLVPARALILLAIVFFSRDLASAAEWQQVFEETFDAPGWRQRWELTGSVGAAATGYLANAGTEMTATLKEPFNAPAVRVEYDAAMRTDPAGEFGDLGCFISNVFYQFGGEYNTISRIRADHSAIGDSGSRIVPGQTHRVIAELNGRVCRMWVDGESVGELLIDASPASKPVKLYTWSGSAEFDNVRVFTKSAADPIPETLLQETVYGHQTPQTLAHLRDWPLPTFAAGRPAAVARERIPLSVDPGPAAAPGSAWPITCGVPLPRGKLYDPAQARVVDAEGREVPSQRTVTATWTQGGSIRWLLLDFLLPADKKAPPLFLEYGSEVAAGPVSEPVSVSENDEAIVVSSGPAQWVVSKKRGTVIESAALDLDGDGAFANGEQILGPADAYFTTRQGGEYRTGAEDDELDVKVEMSGPIRAVIRSRGWYKGSAGRRACCFTRRLYVYRGLPWARLFTTWTVTVDTRAYTFSDIGIRFAVPGAAAGSVGNGMEGEVSTARLTGDDALLAVAADRHKGSVILPLTPALSHGGEREETDGTGSRSAPSRRDSTRGASREAVRQGGHADLRDAPTAPSPSPLVGEGRGEGVAVPANRIETGDLPGWIDLTGPRGGVTLACFELARQWPAALEARTNALVFHAFSGEPGLDLDMTLGGLQKLWGEETYQRFEASRGAYPSIAERNPNGLGIAKTHELMLALHAPKDSAVASATVFQEPPIVSSDPARNCESAVVGPGEYHPYDPEHFAREEAFIEEQRDRLLNALDRIAPWYGFWDYGAGVPHHIGGNIDSDGPLTYNGYRRCYDIGYQQTLVPWMLYLRSGQRPWLAFAVRNARCMMDARIHHWTDPAVSKQVGWAVQDHGTWAWDTLFAGWGFNLYMPTLLFDYYVTGYERAMDVHTEVLDSFARTGSAYYTASAGIWMGNCAAAYRATWEPHYLEKYRECESSILRARCGLCGGIKANRDLKDEDHDKHGAIHRNGWVEYGIMEALQLDGHAPELADILVHHGKELYRTSAGSVSYATMGYSRLLAFRATGDARIAKEGRLLFDRYTSLPSGVFTYFSGPSHARHLPVLMKLALEPGLDDVELPVRRGYPTPLFIRHVAGTDTWVEIAVPQKVAGADIPVQLFGPDGNPATEPVAVHDPVLGRMTLRVPAETPTGAYEIRSTGSEHLSLLHPRATPLVIAIPQGYAHPYSGPMPELWFRVPTNVTSFRVRNNLHERVVTVTRPDGVEVTGDGEWHTIDVPAGLPDKPWAIRSDCRESHNFQILKLYDVPAIVALSPEALFLPDNPPMPAPDYEPRTFDTPFTPGALPKSQALLLNGHDRLEIPLGDPVSPAARQRLDTAQGTIEFFFQLNESPSFAEAMGLPFAIPPDPSAPFRNWIRQWLTFEYKNAVTFLFPDDRTQRGASFGPWDYKAGMTSIEPGRWHHVAVLWNTRKPFAIGNIEQAKSQVRVFLNGRNLNTTVYDTQPQWFPDAYAPPLPAAAIEMVSREHNVFFDELRISDVERVEWDGSRETYPVPSRPYEADDHTLLLMHFDGDFTGTGRAGPFEAKFADSK